MNVRQIEIQYRVHPETGEPGAWKRLTLDEDDAESRGYNTSDLGQLADYAILQAFSACVPDLPIPAFPNSTTAIVELKFHGQEAFRVKAEVYP